MSSILPRWHRLTVRTLIPLIMLGMNAACTDRPDATGPDSSTETESPLRPSLTTAQTWSYSISPTHSNAEVIDPIGDFPYPTLIKVTQSGIEHKFYTEASAFFYPPAAGTLGGSFNARGQYINGTCFHGVEVLIGVTAIWDCNVPTVPLASEFWAVVQGTGVVHWNRNKESRHSFGVEYCGPSTAPCWDFTGGFAITVERLAAELTLTASARAITPGTSVTFTGTVTPATGGPHAMPFEVLSWTWRPDTGAVVPDACSPNPENTNPATCSYQPASSGRMELRALVNGQEETKEVRVEIFPCLTGDSLLDNPDVRKGLRDAWDAAGWPNTLPEDRVERIGGLHCENGQCTSHLYPKGPSDNACDSYFADAPVTANTVVAWHMHPFNPTDPNDPLPIGPACPRSNGGSAAFGPSPKDYEAAGGKPHIVVDPQYVYVIPAADGAETPGPDDLFKQRRTGNTSDVCDPLALPL